LLGLAATTQSEISEHQSVVLPAEEIVFLLIEEVLSALWAFLRIILNRRNSERFLVHLQFGSVTKPATLVLTDNHEHHDARAPFSEPLILGNVLRLFKH
jgi:hypothetical protein